MFMSQNINTVDISNDANLEDYVLVSVNGSLRRVKVADLKALVDSTEDIVVVDTELSTTSVNPVQNRVITEELNKKANSSDMPTYQKKIDNTLTTTSKEVVGAINENTSSINQLSGGKADKSEVSKLKKDLTNMSESVTEINTAVFDRTRNLIAYNEFTEGKWISTSGVVSDFDDSALSDFVEVEPNSTYTFSVGNNNTETLTLRVCYYNDNKDFYDYFGRDIVGTGSFTLTTNPQTKYFRIAGYHLVSFANHDYLQMEKGNTKTEYIGKYVSKFVALENAVDKYWIDELNTKIDTVKANEEKSQTIADVLSFVFITDMHYPYNFRKSPRLLKYLCDNTNIRYILNGGDSIHNNAQEVYTPINCVKMIYEMRKDFKKFALDDMMFCTLGNHDLNTQGSAVGLSARQMYDAVYKKQTDYTNQGGWSWYYQDDAYAKIRFVSVNQYALNSTQLEWVGDIALNLPSDEWGVVIFSHALPYDEPSVDNVANRNSLHLKSILDAFATKTSVNISDISTIWPVVYSHDYSAAKGNIICYIAGHTHLDYAKKDVIQYICTTNDSKDHEQFDRIESTITEQTFDVFTVDKTNRKIYVTRFGYGDNREFEY